MGAKAEVLALFLVFMARLCDCQVVVADQEVVTLPGLFLATFTSLFCEVTPENVTIAIRWNLPNGNIVTEGITGRFFVDDEPGGLGRLNVVLFIDQLSYQDAGVYTCEVMDLDPTIPDAPWIPATVELQLNVNLQALENEVSATNTDSTATLRCEMSDYIREDEDLQWFRGGQQITNGSRHTVRYQDGTPGAAQNGNFIIPARVSVLTISNPVVADSGIYTCQIQGTTESANVQLFVVGAPSSSPPTPASGSSPPTPASGSSPPTLAPSSSPPTSAPSFSPPTSAPSSYTYTPTPDPSVSHSTPASGSSPPTPASGSSIPIWIAAPFVVGVLLVIATGALVGIVIYQQKRIRKLSPSARDSRHPSPMYEDVDIASLNSATDIDVKDNVAYGPATPQQPAAVYEEVPDQTDHRNIEMIGNVAYGQTSH